MLLASLLRSRNSDSPRTQRRRRRRLERHPRQRFVPRLVVLEDRTVLSTFTVQNLLDAGPGSLRQAVLDANATPGANLIDFAPALTGTIGLTSGQLTITNDLTVDALGAPQLAASRHHPTRTLH